MRFDIQPAWDCNLEIGLLAASLQEGTKEWRQELGQIDDDAVAWQPYTSGPSIGSLILHMIEVEAWWIETIGAGRELTTEEATELMCADIKQYELSWPTPPKEPLDYYLALQDRYRLRTLRTIKDFDPRAQVSVEGRPETAYSLRWVVNHVIAHEMYHAGQAVLLNVLYTKSS